jgi:hypothetical protein
LSIAASGTGVGTVYLLGPGRGHLLVAPDKAAIMPILLGACEAVIASLFTQGDGAEMRRNNFAEK